MRDIDLARMCVCSLKLLPDVPLVCAYTYILTKRQPHKQRRMLSKLCIDAIKPVTQIHMCLYIAILYIELIIVWWTNTKTLLDLITEEGGH